jgi:two-component system chemotaxis sensor kinase CheA
LSDALPQHLRAELLDDFYGECDEHLAGMRAQLEALRRGAAPKSALHALYGRMHSFKGNAAIVGLAPAEQLAHAAESLLRDLSRTGEAVSANHVELLEKIEARLGRIVSNYRQSQRLPTIDDLLTPLSGHDHGRETTPAPAPVPKPAAGDVRERTARAEGRAIWQAVFTPTAELNARGVSINRVRDRIAGLGEIIAAEPSVLNRTMRFEFRVALASAPADPAAWSSDGVEWTIVHAAVSPGAPDAGEDAALSIAPSHIVRVDLGRLDELMRIAGDLVIHHSRLQQRIGGDETLQETGIALGRSLKELRQALKRVRMVPLSEVFSRLPFVVRDLAGESGRTVDLAIEGQEIEIDKYLVERLKEPLLHLVRNAVSHGVEPPTDRLAAGKPQRATIRLRATPAGETVRIEISDDGRGVDPASVAAHARENGLPVPERLDDAAVLALLCTPGLSTSSQVDRAAGRGVGMAVVADTVRELGGTLTLATTLGAGTTFTLRLPLTLSVTGTILVQAGAQTCAVPQTFVEEIVQVPASALRAVSGVEVVAYRDGLLPLVRLHSLFKMAAPSTALAPVLVIGTERGSAGLLVERVIGQREVVVRPLHDPLVRVPGVSGATELGDGKPVLLLDPTALTRGAVRPVAAAPALETQPA